MKKLFFAALIFFCGAAAAQTTKALIAKDIKTINGQVITGGPGNIVIAGGATGIDSASYHYVTQLPDSTGFILTRPNGTKDTILVNLGPGVGTYVPIQNSGANGILKTTVFNSPFGDLTNPGGAIGAVTGIVFSDAAAPAYGGILATDQEGTFWFRKSNGTTWRKVIDENNISAYIPPGTGVQYNSNSNLDALTAPPSFFTVGSGSMPAGAVGALVGFSLPHPTVGGYGAQFVADQEGKFFVRKNSASATWRTMLDDQNISSFALTTSNGVGYTSASNANTWTGHDMYVNGSGNIPADAEGLTALNFPYANITGYANQFGVDRYGKWYVRNNNGGTYGTWKRVSVNLNNAGFYDPPSIAPLGTITTSISVAGASLGDIAKGSFSLSLSGMMMTAYVSAADTVTIVIFNPTGSAVDLANGTIKAWVEN